MENNLEIKVMTTPWSFISGIIGSILFKRNINKIEGQELKNVNIRTVNPPEVYSFNDVFQSAKQENDSRVLFNTQKEEPKKDNRDGATN